MMYEASGQIKVILDTQTFASGFTKREFVVTTVAEKYPQDLKFEVVKDKCSILDDFAEGQDVTVTFDIRGNEYNGRYFVNLSCWKLQASDGNAPAQRPAANTTGNRPPAARPASRTNDVEPSAADLRNEDDFDDDAIPF